jgi:hypothetical protein
VEALQAEGVAATGVYDSGIPDWHIYAHWEHIIQKKTPTPDGEPWTSRFHQGPEVKYSREMCPKTLEFLSRVVHIDIPPQMTLDDCDMIAYGINKVARVYG